MSQTQLPDIQDSPDIRGIAIDRVGITGVRYPTVFNDGQIEQRGVADFEISVALAAERRGTHMSRMIELIDEELQHLDPRELPLTAKRALARFDVQSIRISAGLPIALRTVAPISGRAGEQVHDVRVEVQHDGESSHVRTAATVDITSLCPCSKAISDYGAHNQRSRVTVAVIGREDPYPFSVNDIVELIRSVGSAPVYPLVKRSDERHLTMLAFDKPAFVEDIVRDVSVFLRIRSIPHAVEARNIESIHSHDAWAAISWAPGT